MKMKRILIIGLILGVILISGCVQEKTKLDEVVKHCDEIKTTGRGVAMHASIWKTECYLNVAHNISSENLKLAEEICNTRLNGDKYCLSIILGKSSLDRALKGCNELSNNVLFSKDRCICIVAGNIATKDFKKALDLCKETKWEADNYAQPFCFMKVAENLARKDLEKAMKLCDTFTDELEERYQIYLHDKIYYCFEGVVKSIGKDNVNAKNICNQLNHKDTCLSVFQESEKTTEIELTGTIEPDPTYVSLPVTLPIDTKEEALIIAKACGDITMDEYTEIRQTKKGWYIGRTTPNFSDFGITIDKDTGKTECIFYG